MIQKVKKIAKMSLLVLAFFLLGFFGLDLLFSDLSPQETLVERVVKVTLYYLTVGALFGYFLPRKWRLAAFFAWGAVILGFAATLENLLTYRFQEAALSLLLFAPIGLTLAASSLGRNLRKRKKFNVANF